MLDGDRFFRIGLITLAVISTAMMIWALLGFPKAPAATFSHSPGRAWRDTDEADIARDGLIRLLLNSQYRFASSRSTPSPVAGHNRGDHPSCVQPSGEMTVAGAFLACLGRTASFVAIGYGAIEGRRLCQRPDAKAPSIAAEQS
jgi:hypothetical protein